ncbi:MAG: NifB/NifX family molybdenum-iron cluster-binding protein [Desulfamplus sp.]|nr:NifB/NifX family molybdenum-iron cluster-binding protein [Desulfamplus sp.]
MNIALTAWEDRISPVFDSARTLLVVEIKEQKVVSRSIEQFNKSILCNIAEMVTRLNLLKIDVLICGAISEIPSNIIQSNGIKLIPFISGNIEEIIAAYAKDETIISMFLMPGCGLRHRGNNRGKHFRINIEEVRAMPRGDGTGPQGQGQGVGRGTGGCGKKGGKGSGQGQGCGNNSGQGQERGQGGSGRGLGQGGGVGKSQGGGSLGQAAYSANSGDELTVLKQQAQAAKDTLDSIAARIAELEKIKD